MDDELILTIQAINDNKWWRLFDMKGLTLKLIKPISDEYYPHFKGDRNYITIVGYCVDGYTNRAVKPHHQHLSTDWALFENKHTPFNPNYSINLSLVDFDYFKTLMVE